MNAIPSQSLPTTIAAYLDQLRQALAGADPALVQDALYDAEDYLRSELAAQPGSSEAEVVASVASSYGNPEEVAQIYLETEVTVQRALHGPASAAVAAATSAAGVLPVTAAAGGPAAASRPAPGTGGEAGDGPGPVPPAPPRSLLRRIFGVYTDPATYGALFYLLLSLATGVFYFSWIITGVSMSLGMLVLIIGVPLLVLFLASVRVLALVEGRVVEALLGVRMPRRPPYTLRDQPWLKRIGAMFTDPRTWATMAYFLLMLPLGVTYFTLAIVGLVTSLSLVAVPFLVASGGAAGLTVGGVEMADQPWAWPLLLLAGGVLLTLTLHLARRIGRLHGGLAKHLLVRPPRPAGT